VIKKGDKTKFKIGVYLPPFLITNAKQDWGGLQRPRPASRKPQKMVFWLALMGAAKKPFFLWFIARTTPPHDAIGV